MSTGPLAARPPTTAIARGIATAAMSERGCGRWPATRARGSPGRPGEDRGRRAPGSQPADHVETSRSTAPAASVTAYGSRPARTVRPLRGSKDWIADAALSARGLAARYEELARKGCDRRVADPRREMAGDGGGAARNVAVDARVQRGPVPTACHVGHIAKRRGAGVRKRSSQPPHAVRPVGTARTIASVPSASPPPNSITLPFAPAPAASWTGPGKGASATADRKPGDTAVTVGTDAAPESRPPITMMRPPKSTLAVRCSAVGR